MASVWSWGLLPFHLSFPSLPSAMRAAGSPRTGLLSMRTASEVEATGDTAPSPQERANLDPAPPKQVTYPEPVIHPLVTCVSPLV